MIERGLSYCVVAAVLAGCSTVPENISTPVAGPGVSEVRTNPDAHTGKRVRWGGTISDVRNLQNRSAVTVVARRLSRNGEPRGDERSIGRFIAEVDRFLDPAEYKSGRRITVVGRVTGVRPSKIDEYVYDHPVVRAQDIYLWEEYVRRRHRYPYYWPYYDPFWHYPYSWHRRHFHGFGHYPWYY